MKGTSAWSKVDKKEVFTFAENYRKFLSQCKTEREVVEYMKELLKDQDGLKLFEIRGKALVIFADSGDVKNGFRIIASHIDVPRIDLKPNPLFEDTELAMMETHYYGGIKKYQWVARPLALHGVVVKEDGTVIKVNIGDKEGDPVFTFADLLPHLSRKIQGDKKISEAIPGEKLDLLVGNIPVEKIIKDTEVKDKVKENILRILKEQYNIEEEDFVSAEIEIVPQGEAKDVGFDKGLIGGYGHDDRVCAYTSVMAIKDARKFAKPALVILYDKEEIGSDGNTGAQSLAIEYVITQILKEKGITDYYTLREVMYKSEAISADVTAGVNPGWKEVHEIKNAAKIGYGLAISKYTGHGGKYSSNDAHAEFVAKVRRILNKNNVVWQVAELGKIDEGGGGTVAKYLSKFGIDTIDAGVPLLGMHSPFEIASKVDIYMAYKGYKAFLETE